MKKPIIVISLLIIAAFVVVEAVFWLGSEEPEIYTRNIEFTFANEADFDTTMTAYINGDEVYTSKELISYITAGGYFGQEFEYVDINVPDAEFTLTVKESGSELEKSVQIYPTRGEFVDITFWGESFVITQTIGKQVRID